MYVPLLKIEQTYYAIRNKSHALPSVQQFIDELTDILYSHQHHLVSYVTIRKGKVIIMKSIHIFTINLRKILKYPIRIEFFNTFF